ncbi:hypothetical protein Zm00014a_004675 [Zea mays]|uniref:Uncharacterized protein n=1 Tax=Zea mays TaxID=4577 RepID=A0A3L6G535_MAIZE|nr:hypothetical protein Zm00014a_004675 [Zea mays]
MDIGELTLGSTGTDPALLSLISATRRLLCSSTYSSPHLPGVELVLHLAHGARPPQVRALDLPVELPSSRPSLLLLWSPSPSPTPSRRSSSHGFQCSFWPPPLPPIRGAVVGSPQPYSRQSSSPCPSARQRPLPQLTPSAVAVLVWDPPLAGRAHLDVIGKQSVANSFPVPMTWIFSCLQSSRKTPPVPAPSFASLSCAIRHQPCLFGSLLLPGRQFLCRRGAISIVIGPTTLSRLAFALEDEREKLEQHSSNIGGMREP